MLVILQPYHHRIHDDDDDDDNVEYANYITSEVGLEKSETKKQTKKKDKILPAMVTMFFWLVWFEKKVIDAK